MKNKKQYPEYSTWQTMKSRCYCPSQDKRGKYRENNIIVCDEWKHSFENFYNDMGEKPDGYTLERIDNNKSYNKENCIWADWNTQSRNKSSNIIIEYNNESKVLEDWASHFNIKYTTLYNRMFRSNLSFEQAINRDPFNKLLDYNGESKTLKDWCITLDLNFKQMNCRIQRGWEVERAFTTPIKGN